MWKEKNDLYWILHKWKGNIHSEFITKLFVESVTWYLFNKYIWTPVALRYSREIKVSQGIFFKELTPGWVDKAG